MRYWLLGLALVLAGCAEQGVLRYERTNTSGWRLFHDFAMCGGGGNTFIIDGGPTDRCMFEKGYTRRQPNAR